MTEDLSQHLRSFEDSVRQHERACAEMDQLQDDVWRKSQELERSRCELEVLRYRMPPSHRISMVETQISTSKAEIKELEKRMKEVEVTVADYGMKLKSYKGAIAELLEEDRMVREVALIEAQQAQMAAFEKKLVSVTKAKDDEIRRCKTHLNHQRIKMICEHRATIERQELYHSRIAREIEGRYQKALTSAETQYITELQSKNERIRDLESKVTKLEAQLLVRQSSIQKRIKKWFKRKRRTTDDSKHSGMVQRVRVGELTSDYQLSKYPIHTTKEQDQASFHASTISPPSYYDQHSLRSLPAMHFREMQSLALVPYEQDQSNANRIISPQESEYLYFAEGYGSEPENDDIALILNPRIDSTTAAV